MEKLVGLDLGGTKIEGVVLESAANPRVIERMRIPTEAAQGYDHIISQIKKLVDELSGKIGEPITGFGIGTPGALDPTMQVMKNSNTTALNGKPLKADLEKALGYSIKMANDANCFALAEATMGVVPTVAPQAEVVFGVIMGTGVGGGVVVNGKVLNGRHGIGGEWGHNFLHDSGGPCYCGKDGCVETILSGPASERFYERISGKKLKLKEIYENYQAGNDPFAQRTIKRLLHFFGVGMSTIINMLDPDVIVLGGGVGNIDLLYTEGVAEVVKHAFNPRVETLFLKPSLGDSAGVFGAAMLMK